LILKGFILISYKNYLHIYAYLQNLWSQKLAQRFRFFDLYPHLAYALSISSHQFYVPDYEILPGG